MQNFKKIIFSAFLAAFLLGGVAVPAFAQRPTIPCTPGLNLPCISQETQQTPGGVQKHITDTFGVRFLNGFLGLCALTSVIFIIVGGAQLLLNLGNEEAVGKAKKTLIWAVAGLVIAILSVGIVRVVTSISFE